MNPNCVQHLADDPDQHQEFPRRLDAERVRNRNARDLREGARQQCLGEDPEDQGHHGEPSHQPPTARGQTSVREAQNQVSSYQACGRNPDPRTREDASFREGCE